MCVSENAGPNIPDGDDPCIGTLGSSCSLGSYEETLELLSSSESESDMVVR